MNRELLSACRCRSCEKDCLSLATLLLDYLVYTLVVEICVVVSHPARIRAVEVYNSLLGDSLTKISLEAVDTHIHELLKISLVPCAGIRIREIHKSHSRLPHIPLPYIAVCPLYKVSALHTLFKESALLSNIGVNPYADIKTLVLDSLKKSCRIREYILIPDKISPVELLHPEAVKVEGPERNPTVKHSIDEAHYSLLIVVCREGCRQPQTKGPGCRHCRLASKICISYEHILHGISADYIVIKVSALNGELTLRYILRSQLELNRVRMRNENSVSLVADVEGNIFITLISRCTAVLILSDHSLTILNECSESLTSSVNMLINSNRELLTHECVFKVSCQFICHARIILLDTREVTALRACENLAVSLVLNSEIALCYLNTERPALDDNLLISFRYVDGKCLSQTQVKLRELLCSAPVMYCLKPYDVFSGRSDADCQVYAT